MDRVGAAAQGCVYCDNVVTGNCQKSQAGDPHYEECEEDSVNCNHWGAFCDPELAVVPEPTGVVRYADVQMPVLEVVVRNMGASTQLLRSCRGEIIARAYSAAARERMRAAAIALSM